MSVVHLVSAVKLQSIVKHAIRIPHENIVMRLHALQRHARCIPLVQVLVAHVLEFKNFDELGDNGLKTWLIHLMLWILRLDNFLLLNQIE